MVEIVIDSKEIKKSVFMIVLFNAVFPKVLEESGVMINIKENGNVQKMCYECFINKYDILGLNKVAD